MWNGRRVFPDANCQHVWFPSAVFWWHWKWSKAFSWEVKTDTRRCNALLLLALVLWVVSISCDRGSHMGPSSLFDRKSLQLWINRISSICHLKILFSDFGDDDACSMYPGIKLINSPFLSSHTSKGAYFTRSTYFLSFLISHCWREWRQPKEACSRQHPQPKTLHKVDTKRYLSEEVGSQGHFLWYNNKVVITSHSFSALWCV